MRLRLREIFFVVITLGIAALTGYNLALLVYGTSPATPIRLPAGNSSPAAVAPRRTAVLGESSTLSQPSSTPPVAARNTTATPAPPEASASIGSAPASNATTPPLPIPTASAVPTTEQVAERLVEDSFASTSSGWIIRDAETWNARYADEQYELALTGQQNLHLSSPLPEGDYRLSVDIAVTQGGAGIVFLAVKPATFYRIMINVDGFYALQMEHQDEVRDLISWTSSTTLQRGADSKQRMRVERQGETIRFFANEQVLITWPVPDGDVVNQYGFAITAQQGEARATFDNLVVERLLQP